MITEKEQNERLARFEKAKQARERDLKEHQFENFEKVDVPEFEVCVLKPNRCHIVRLIGNSVETAEKNSDPILVEKSMILDDEKKWFTLIWSRDMEHPMRKLMKTVLGSYEYDQEKKQRIYKNEGIPVFKRFLTNNYDGGPFNQGMLPQKYILFNCISRGKDDDWCKKNKHTKLLCWDSNIVEKDGKEREFPTYGIKPSLYKEIFDVKCTTLKRHFEDTDFVIRRFTQKTKMGDKYICVMSPEEKSAIRNWGEEDNIDYLSYVNDDYLSDEENSYERYNLVDIPFISAPTPCSVILKKLGKYIKEVDAYFNTNYYEEFVEWKAKEIEQRKKTESENSVNSNNIEEENSEVNDTELPSEVEFKKPTKKLKFSKEEKFIMDDEFFKKFPNVKGMSHENQSLIIGYDGDTLHFIDGDIAECECGKDIHDDFTQCPYCGAEFE